MIANAVQRGSTVYVLNERGQTLYVQSLSGKNDKLNGYTQNSVSIQRGRTIYTYDENGSCTGVFSV